MPELSPVRPESPGAESDDLLHGPILPPGFEPEEPQDNQPPVYQADIPEYQLPPEITDRLTRYATVAQDARHVARRLRQERDLYRARSALDRLGVRPDDLNRSRSRSRSPAPRRQNPERSRSKTATSKTRKT